jgi:hypothetical protein
MIVTPCLPEIPVRICRDAAAVKSRAMWPRLKEPASAGRISAP